jgi:hypothetical protein
MKYPDRKRQFGRLLARTGNQSARGRKYDSLTLAPSPREVSGWE